MLYFAAYLFITIMTFRIGYARYYDGKDGYTTDNEFRVFWLFAALLWPIFIPCALIWLAATIGSPKSPKVKQAERQAKLDAVNKEIFRRQVQLADLEVENGYPVTDPPKGWVPKGRAGRYVVDRELV